MRQAGTISDERQAQRFADYLLTQGIRTKVEPDGDAWAVWIHDERYIDRGREELQAFRENPTDPRFAEAAPQAAEIRHEEIKWQKQHAKNMVDVRRRWSGGIGRHTPVTTVFLVLMVVATFATDFGSKFETAKWLRIASYSLVNERTREVTSHLPEIFSGQVWRLVTPIFMHGGWIHLFFGLYMFFHFGRLVEMRRGSWRLLGICIATAAISNFAEYWLADFKDWGGGVIQPSPYFLGMSGVIYGLLGYAWIRGKFDPYSGLRLPPDIIFFAIAWLVICLTGFMPIANIAHVFGLATGMAIGYWPVLLRQFGFGKTR